MKEGSVYFFLHSLLWSFAPWALFFYGINFLFLKKKVFDRVSIFSKEDILVLSGFLPIFVIFSVSKFQLPHYTNIIFPLGALIVSNFWYRNLINKNVISVFQFIYSILLLFIVFYLQFWLFRPGNNDYFLIIFALYVFSCFILKYRCLDWRDRLLYSSYLLIFFVGLYLNLIFNPSLLKYQAGSQAAYYLNLKRKDIDSVAFLDQENLLFDFYYKGQFRKISEINRKNDYIFVFSDKKSLEEKYDKNEYRILKEFEDYTVTRLKEGFLNFRTRSNFTEKYVLAEIFVD